MRNEKPRLDRFPKNILCTISLGLTLGFIDASVSSGNETTPAAQMFPDTTQAFVTLPDTARFIELWGKTQLGALALDDQLSQFWNSQRDELKSRLSEAGWQLSFQVEDIESIADGQTAIGWIAREGAKPYSVAALIDLGAKDLQAREFLERVDKELKQRKAVKKQVKVNEVDVTQYEWPSPANPNSTLQSFYAISKGQLIAADDLVTVREFLEAQTVAKKNSLGNSSLYKDSQSKLKGSPQTELEYFVNPFGMAQLLRSIGGKPKKNQPDLLKLLTDLGFGGLKCMIGNVQFSRESHDLVHQGFVKLEKPVAEAVKILDFPNVGSFDMPAWLSAESASVLAFSWNFKEAFPRFKYLVDGYMNQETFDGVIDDIKMDPQGPQIDIYKEVLPYISSQFFIVTQVTRPITPDSKRSLVAVKLNDPKGVLKGVIDRYGKNEPHGEPEDYKDHRIWLFTAEDEEEIEIDFGTGTKKPGSISKSGETEASDDEPLLERWAITIADGYFLFGSDSELLKETIDRITTKNNKLLAEKDVQRVMKELGELSPNEQLCMQQIDRSELSFEMQYELFREGKLNASRSVAAAILDRILDPKKKNQDKQQKLNGAALPPFEQIRKYFLPAGNVIRTTDDGWYIQSFILAPEKN